MKMLIRIGCAFAIISCNTTDKKNESFLPILKKAEQKLQKADATDSIQMQIDSLKTRSPLPIEKLRNKFPKKLLGIKKTSYNTGQATVVQVSTGEAFYTDKEKDRVLHLSITDGAGQNGSAVVSLLMFILGGTIDKKTENGFEKTTNVGNQKVYIKEEMKNGRTCSLLQLVYDNRFLISIEGENFSAHELTKAVQQLNLSNLN